MRAPLCDRFHAKYIADPNSGCWLWVGSDNGRYGLLASGGRQLKAHRVSFELHNGPIPPGMVVMHRCDIPTCVNPAHLQLGTQLDNIRDRDRKGRQVPNRPSGALNGMAKITEPDARTIKSLSRDGAISKDLAAIFGVTPATIRSISSGRRWVAI